MTDELKRRTAQDKELYLKFRRDALEYLVNQELIAQEGKKLKMEPEDGEVDKELNGVKQRFPSQEAFEQLLKAEGFTEEKLRGFIKRAMTVRKVLEVKVKPLAKPVTVKDIENFYEENKERFAEPEKVKASHILLQASPDASEEEKTAAKATLQTVLEEAKGGADFAELAKKHSQCPSAPQGRDLGYFTRGRMVPEFEEAAFKLEPGQISDIVETQFGYHIILVQDKKPKRQLDIEEVSKRIKDVLSDKEMDTALKEWLKPIREQADVEILLAG
jgi:peptidyl-prolyl cis-trans isomerase C